MAVVKPETFLEYLIIEYRWLIAITVLMPASFLWKIYLTIRNYIVFKMNSAAKHHDKKVKEVQSQVKEWVKGDRKTKLCTARPTWQTMSFRHALYKKTFTNIRINLVDILDIDTKNMTVRCEPLVTMGQLSRALEPLGLMIPVVPEMDQLTVGGLINATGVETSSHIYGLFQHICVEYELVLADGSVVTCNEKENSDLFYAVPWSYGTLGFLTSAVLKVIPTKKYVRLEYQSYTNLPDLSNKFRDECNKEKPHDFVEALMYTKDTGVVMMGDMVDEIGNDGKFNDFGKWHAEWFFKQVERYLKKYQQGQEKSAVEYIPLKSYIYRHTRSFFWELQDIIPFGNNVIFRYLFGWMMPPEVSLLKLTQPEAVTKLYNRAHVIQDMLVPIEDLEEAVEVFHKEFEVYPLWLCPFVVFNNPGQLKINTDKPKKMFVDLGVYGSPKAEGFSAEASTRKIEHFVSQKQGFQMMYGDTYVTLEEFRRMFDHTVYDKLRKSLPYCSEAFPEIYGKVNKSVRI